MDLALLIFLIQAAIVEYFAENFMRFWYRRAEEVTQSRLTDLNNSIQNRYRWVTLAIVVCFVLASSALWIVLLTFAAKFPVKTVETAVLGSLGYLFVSLALFNLIVLFSLNRPMPVLRAIVLAVFANFSTGYILSHLAGVQYAAVGLLLGGVVLYWTSRRVIVSTLEHSDYFYALA